MKVFPIKKNTVFTYGDALYAPNINFTLPQDLIVHEETHTRQQGEDPAGWWDRYLVDPAFRLEQEVEAYRNQYRFYCKNHKGRNERFNFLRIIASDLASPMYGNLIGFLDATNRIKS